MTSPAANQTHWPCAANATAADASADAAAASQLAAADSQTAAAASAVAADASADAAAASAASVADSEAAAAASALAADASADAAAASVASISGGPVTSVNGMTGVVTGLATADSVAAKQDTLVSGTNIKTVGGVSLLGSGNVDISAPASGLTLIATLTPTAAANVDALTVFSSTYDDYLILMDGVRPASDQDLGLRFANAGVVDSSSVYFWAQEGGSGGPYAGAFVTDTSVLASGAGVNAAIQIQNANSSGLKTLSRDVYVQIGASSYRCYKVNGFVYTGAAVSGVRLYGASGANFAAQGTIRIYGYSKT